MRAQSTEYIVHSKAGGLIFVVSGPSGTGKTTLLKKLFQSKALKQQGLVKSISLTTRPKRSGEENGRDYFFISEDEFRKRLQAKKVLEYTRYLGCYYGTPKDFILRQLAEAKSPGLCLDVRGAQSIKAAYPKTAVTIFVLPPSLDALSERIEKRCSATKKEERRRRLALATKEIDASKHYDYRIVNRNLKDAVRQLQRIIERELGVKNFA